MNYVIISIYDGMYGFDVLENGEHIEAKREKEIGSKICALSKIGSFCEDVYNFLKDYYKDYDLIIISEDEFTNVVCRDKRTISFIIIKPNPEEIDD